MYFNFLKIKSMPLSRNQNGNTITCSVWVGRQRKQGMSGMAFSANGKMLIDLVVKKGLIKLAENKAWSEITCGEGPTRINT